jgi:hypothetical protein
MSGTTPAQVRDPFSGALRNASARAPAVCPGLGGRAAGGGDRRRRQRRARARAPARPDRLALLERGPVAARRALLYCTGQCRTVRHAFSLANLARPGPSVAGGGEAMLDAARTRPRIPSARTHGAAVIGPVVPKLEFSLHLDGRRRARRRTPRNGRANQNVRRPWSRTKDTLYATATIAATPRHGRRTLETAGPWRRGRRTLGRPPERPTPPPARRPPVDRIGAQPPRRDNLPIIPSTPDAGQDVSSSSSRERVARAHECAISCGAGQRAHHLIAPTLSAVATAWRLRNPPQKDKQASDPARPSALPARPVESTPLGPPNPDPAKHTPPVPSQ